MTSSVFICCHNVMTEILYNEMYTVGHKKRATFIFFDNSGKY